MTLFPSAFRTDHPWGTSSPLRPVRGLKHLVSRLRSRQAPATASTFSVVTAHANGTHHERPEPLLKWTDPRTAPDGDFRDWAVPNGEIGTTGVPGRSEPWDAVSEFALSYDGYGYWDDLPELASRVLQRWTRSRALPATLDELRGCLFYEQRRWHHFGEEPTGRSAEYMRAMVEAIAGLCAGVPRTMRRIPDPRPTAAAETHVKLVATRAVALRPLHSPPLTLRPVPASAGRLVPVPAAEAHVRLVSVLEETGSVWRHPSGQSSRHPSGRTSEHPSMSRVIRELKPMPTADPLPKPPVIVRRSQGTGPGTPDRPRAVAPATRPTPMCHEFSYDDTGYRTWVQNHPDGFVLNQPRTARAKAPTLHRVGCAVVAHGGRDGETLTVTAIKVCGPSADTLRTWSMARGSGRPTVCRRCQP